tara:strand:- start:256 stop:1128 length:873 start_codon:yes stop_codon:yes gene_type:complete
MKNKKLAVIVCGWHYPAYFYKQLISQKKPKGWDIDYFCVSHRDPKYAIGEKDISKDSDDLYKKLDYFYYKDIATIKSIKDDGWIYMEKPNTLGDWGVFNQWIDDYDYKDYDMVFLSGDDNFFIRDDLFESVLGGNFETWFSNGDVGNHVVSEVPYDDDWLVLSHSIHRGRGVLRGSMEFFKREILEMLDGKFDFTGCDLNARLNNTSTPKDYRDEVSLNWNHQCMPFMHFIEKNNLYTKIRFLTSTYRASMFCIEGERGMFSYSNVAVYDSLYRDTVQFLNDNKMLDFIE